MCHVWCGIFVPIQIRRKKMKREKSKESEREKMNAYSWINDQNLSETWWWMHERLLVVNFQGLVYSISSYYFCCFRVIVYGFQHSFRVRFNADIEPNWHRDKLVLWPKILVMFQIAPQNSTNRPPSPHYLFMPPHLMQHKQQN